MLLQFLFCFLLNHLSFSAEISLSLIQMNAAMIAVCLFAFIAVRLRTAARERERRVAAALLIW